MDHKSISFACYPLIISCFMSILTFASCSSGNTSRSMPLMTSAGNASLDRSSFPDGFVFGTMTLAVKHEGSSAQKADSIWDTYARIDGVVLDGTSPGDAGGEYTLYEEDIEYLAKMGVDAFRFSLAWTRILSDRSGTPNAEGVSHYNALIDKLIANGIEPHVTLWAEDHPQALEDAYGGLLSPIFIDDYVTYANVCFTEFGDRVKYWITFDEPNDYAGLAYASTQSPPGRCTAGLTRHGNCSQGNSSTEPYIAAHNILLAHAAAAKLYKTQFQATQEGYIGIALWFKWYEPLNVTNSSDIAAAKRAQDFFLGWFMDPLAFGDYPETMQIMLGPRLPTFTEEQARDLRQSFDFVGLNAITATYVTDSDLVQEAYEGYFEDMRVTVTPYRDGEVIGKGDNEFAVPWCMKKILDYMRDVYHNPPVYITELGWGISSTSDVTENLNDTERVEFFESYFTTVSQTISDGTSDVRGLFTWSLIDGFEFFLGSKVRFGLFYVDDEWRRYPRASAVWLQSFLTSSNTASDNLFPSHSSSHQQVEVAVA